MSPFPFTDTLPPSMFEQQNPYAVGAPAITVADNERTAFIRRTYTHLSGAVLALVALEVVLFNVVPADTMFSLVRTMTAGYGWLLVLGAFMGVSWMARSWASSDTSKGLQYLGLGVYVCANAVLLLPLLYMSINFIGPELPVAAAAITSVTFMGLTVFVFATKADLSGWGKYLAIAGIVAMAMIVASIVIGFNLGILFSGAMIGLMCGYILYDTSNILHHYRTDQHVAASLSLFASVVTLFWYILRLMIALSGRD
ncbi:MAG: Bax inhibitor-1 family protein [Planctomycetota bacterium]